MADPFHLLGAYAMGAGGRNVTIKSCIGIIFLQVISVSVQRLSLRVEIFLELGDFPPHAFKRSVSFFPAFRRRGGQMVRLCAGWGG